jgi:spore photoproduct lyase
MADLKIVFGEYELLDGSRKVLVKQIGDGSVIKRFDRTPLPTKETDVVCPHFLELKWATGCPYDCAWCYLKGTLRFCPTGTRPNVKPFNKVQQHVRAFLDGVQCPEELLNSGEIADSLMWERNELPFSKLILPLFRAQGKHKLLFVTKSNSVQHLLANGYQDWAVVSFSFNADPVAQEFERSAPTVEQRIEAATKLSKAGYEVRIRIDPMIPILGWEKYYAILLHDIFNKFRPTRITLGSLRGLQSTVNRASDKSWVKYLSDRSNWGKRIDFNIRYLMYAKTVDLLEREFRYSDVALCKETLSVWNKLGMNYKNIRCNCIP